MKWDHLACWWAAVWGAEARLGTTHIPGRRRARNADLWSGAYLLYQMTSKCSLLLFFKPEQSFAQLTWKLSSTRPTYQLIFLLPSGKKEPGGETCVTPAKTRCWRGHQPSAAPSTVAHQAPLSMVFSGQGYWSGLPFPIPEDLPDPGIKPASPTLAGGFFMTSAP